MNTSNLPSLFSQLNRIEPFAFGFNDLFNQLDYVANQQTNFPRFNVTNWEDGHISISVALAGYDESELEVSVENSTLIIAAKTAEKEKQENQTIAHHGIAHRSFKQYFEMADCVEVEDATFKNGLLVVTLKKLEPERKEAKIIPINKK